jgi:hypothetical protein
METLRTYLNGLALGRQREFAVKCETTIEYLRKAISKGQKLGPALSVLIEIHSAGVISRKDLHPADWMKIWPELNSKATAA